MVSNRTVGHFTKVLQGPRAYQEALGVSLANLKRAALAAPPSGPDMLSLEDTEGQLEEEMSCMPDISAPASATQASLGGLGGAPALEHHVDGASSGMLALECGPASTSTSIMPPTPTHASASDCNWQFLDVLRAGFIGSVQQSSYAALASGKHDCLVQLQALHRGPLSPQQSTVLKSFGRRQGQQQDADGRLDPLALLPWGYPMLFSLHAFVAADSMKTLPVRLKVVEALGGSPPFTFVDGQQEMNVFSWIAQDLLSIPQPRSSAGLDMLEAAQPAELLAFLLHEGWCISKSVDSKAVLEPNGDFTIVYSARAPPSKSCLLCCFFNKELFTAGLPRLHFFQIQEYYVSLVQYIRKILQGGVDHNRLKNELRRILPNQKKDFYRQERTRSGSRPMDKAVSDGNAAADPPSLLSDEEGCAGCVCNQCKCNQLIISCGCP